MSKIRVYEAARKLNIETSDLVSILNELEIDAKSPISFISEDEFDTAANVVSEKNQQGVEASASIEPVPEPVSEVIEEEKEAEVIPFAPRSEPAKETPAEAPLVAKSDDSKSASSVPTYISFAAAAIASFALVASFGLYTQLTELKTSVAAIQVGLGESQVAAQSASNQASLAKGMAQENFGAITAVDSRLTGVEKARVKNDLNRHASALSESSAAAPADSAARINSLAERISSLAGSL